MDPLALHKTVKGKIHIQSTLPPLTPELLAAAYTPGVAAPCRAIAEERQRVYDYTAKGNMVAIVTDGSAVLGLGNIGPEASLPVMEGKAMLLREFAGISAIPIALATQDTEEIIRTVTNIAPMFGAIQMEDIAAPRCFEIETRLNEILDIPVFHDDQHATAIVILAGLYNALTVVNKSLDTIRIVISGAGAAGIATARLLLAAGATQVLMVDSQGIISTDRTDLSPIKQTIAHETNTHTGGTLQDALYRADVCIGVSRAGIISQEMVAQMNKDAILFALANPTPEIMPHLAYAAGAKIVATGRNDFPNQLNNVLVFPGIFHGLLHGRIRSITTDMKLNAARALAKMVSSPKAEEIIPTVFTPHIMEAISTTIRTMA